MITCKDRVVHNTGSLDEILTDYEDISRVLVSKGVPAVLLMSAGSHGIKRALEKIGITDRDALIEYLNKSLGGDHGE